MGQDELNTFLMEQETEKLFEQRKFVWDHGKKMYKKLKVDMKGNVIKERVSKDPTGISVDDRYKKWKKSNLMGI